MIFMKPSKYFSILEVAIQLLFLSLYTLLLYKNLQAKPTNYCNSFRVQVKYIELL